MKILWMNWASTVLLLVQGQTRSIVCALGVRHWDRAIHTWELTALAARLKQLTTSAQAALTQLWEQETVAIVLPEVINNTSEQNLIWKIQEKQSSLRSTRTSFFPEVWDVVFQKRDYSTTAHNKCCKTSWVFFPYLIPVTKNRSLTLF